MCRRQIGFASDRDRVFLIYLLARAWRAASSFDSSPASMRVLLVKVPTMMRILSWIIALS